MNDHHCLYVSPDGDDASSGRLPAARGADGPLATFDAARDKVRKLCQGGLDRPVTVMALEGTHRLNAPVQLDGRDSGTETCPVTWTAFPGHHPIISGGRVLTHWAHHEGPIRRCALPEARGDRLMFRQLFFNGHRQIRARWPKLEPFDPLYAGWAFVEKTLPEEVKNPDTLVYIGEDTTTHVHAHGRNRTWPN